MTILEANVHHGKQMIVDHATTILEKEEIHNTFQKRVFRHPFFLLVFWLLTFPLWAYLVESGHDVYRFLQHYPAHHSLAAPLSNTELTNILTTILQHETSPTLRTLAQEYLWKLESRFADSDQIALKDRWQGFWQSPSEPGWVLYEKRGETARFRASYFQTIQWEKRKEKSNIFNAQGFQVDGQLSSRVSFWGRQENIQSVNDQFVDEEFITGYRKLREGIYYDDNMLAAVSFDAGEDWFIHVGNLPVRWGEGHFASLQLNPTHEPYGHLWISKKIGQLKLQFLHASLTYETAVDSLAYRFLAAHRLDWQTPKWGLGVAEYCIYYRTSPELQYLIPVALWRPMEHNLWDRDNVGFGVDAYYCFTPFTKLYVSLFLDDLSISRIGGDHVVNKHGMLTGFQWTHLPFNSQLIVEQYWIRPYVYSHWKSENRFMHNNECLGFPFPPNSATWIGEWNAQWNWRWQSKLQCGYRIHSENTATEDYGGDWFDPYVDGTDAEYVPFLKYNCQYYFWLQGSMEFRLNRYLDVYVDGYGEQHQNEWQTKIAIGGKIHY